MTFLIFVLPLQFWSINMIQDERIMLINTLYDDRIWKHMSFYRQHSQVIKYRTI